MMQRVTVVCMLRPAVDVAHCSQPARFPGTPNFWVTLSCGLRRQRWPIHPSRTFCPSIAVGSPRIQRIDRARRPHRGKAAGKAACAAKVTRAGPGSWLPSRWEAASPVRDRRRDSRGLAIPGNATRAAPMYKIVLLAKTHEEGVRAEEIRSTLGMQSRKVALILNHGITNAEMTSKGHKKGGSAKGARSIASTSSPVHE